MYSRASLARQKQNVRNRPISPTIIKPRLNNARNLISEKLFLTRNEGGRYCVRIAEQQLNKKSLVPRQIALFLEERAKFPVFICYIESMKIVIKYSQGEYMWSRSERQ